MWIGRFIAIEPYRSIFLALALTSFSLTPEALADSRMEKKTETAQETSRVQYLACGACAMLFLDDDKTEKK